MTKSSYENADPELLRYAVGAAEARVGAQLSAGLAADQRALVFAGFLVAGIVAAGGGIAALLSAAAPDIALLVVGGLVAIMLLAALALAIYSARPVGWWLVGHDPADWQEDIANGMPLEKTLPELAEVLDRRVKENRAELKRNSRCLLWAGWMAFAALVAGIMGFVTIGLCRLG